MKRAGSKKFFLHCLLPAACCLLLGCHHSATAKRATDIDPQLATQDYWLSQPAVASADAPDFDTLWKTCRSTVHDRFFQIDREDYREGTLTTLPLVSKLYWEIWRRDVVTVPDIADSTLATIRRTVHFQFTRKPDGGYTVEPKVVVERFSSAERRLTAITEYHTAFSGPRAFGSAEVDRGLLYPTDYWYAVGRDNALERDLIDTIKHRLRSLG